MDNALPDKIPDIDATQAPQPLGEGQQSPVEKPFQEYMNAPAQGQSTTSTGVETPYSLTQKQSNQMEQPTIDSLQQQATNTSDTLDQLHGQLNTKNLKLKQSQKYLLRNKLSEASTNIRTAATKTGVDPGPSLQIPAKQNPIRRYLAYVSDSQNQISSIQAKLKDISGNPAALTPGEMLLIQVKLNKAQQALEYSSVLLGKAVDDVKMLFNVQI
jgi:hypothetical protein